MSKATKTPEIEPLSDFGKQLAAVLEMAGPWQGEGKPTFTDLLTQAMHKHQALAVDLDRATRLNAILSTSNTQLRQELSEAVDHGKTGWARLSTVEAANTGLKQELAEQETEKLELVQANMGLGELLGDVLHELKEAWGQGEWQNIHHLIEHLKSKAGPASDKHSDTCPTLAASPQEAAAGPREPVLSGQHYQHYKGTEYVVLCVAKKEADASQLEVVYSPVEVDETYTRPLAEFCAPRFVLLPGPRTSTLLVGEIQQGECHFDEDHLIEDPDWFSPLAFDSAADYGASVKSVTDRIASGEVQPREPDEEREQIGVYETSGLPVYEGDDYALDVEGIYLTRDEANALLAEQYTSAAPTLGSKPEGGVPVPLLEATPVKCTNCGHTEWEMMAPGCGCSICEGV